MTEEDILHLARKAGVVFYPSPAHNVRICFLQNLERFANLVALAEREKFCSALKVLHDNYEKKHTT
jgi:hypothetical protein